MPRPVPEQELQAIEDAVRHHPGGVTVQQIADALEAGLPRRTLQYRLKYLVDAKRLIAEGERRWTKYRLPHEQYGEVAEAAAARDESEAEVTLPLSKTSVEIQDYLHQPTTARKPVGYNRDFLESYRPNVTTYLSQTERARLRDSRQPQHRAATSRDLCKADPKQASHRPVVEFKPP